MDAREGFVSSESCRECHEKEYTSWHHSFHRTMTQPALEGNVKGKFEGQTIDSDGLQYKIGSDTNGFWAEMPDPDIMMLVVQGGKKLAFKDIPRVRRPVVMTTGSHHYQTYWVESGRFPRLMQTLPLIYLLEDQRWIPREDAFMRPPGSEHRLITQWNHHCIRCHSTGGNPGLDLKTGQLNTHVGEFGISCEACHGRGELHAGRMKSNPSLKGDAARSDIKEPSQLDHRRSSQICGQCHGIFVMKDEFAMASATNSVLYQPGEDLLRTRYYIEHPARSADPARKKDFERNKDFFRERWWDDGTILAGGREYSALSVSKCFTKGEMSCLTCLTCHSMHKSEPDDQLKRDFSAQTCIQCHMEPKFTTEVAKHTRHKAGSEGNDCLNCHMPRTTYALFSSIRSHQIESPRIVKGGPPNACNLCHLNQTIAWAADALAQRSPGANPKLGEDEKTVAAGVLWLLKGNAAERAITAWHTGWKPAQETSGADWIAPFQARLLNDPYGVVRYLGLAGLRTLPGFSTFKLDFTAPEATRREAVTNAMEIWGSAAVRPRPNPRLLINADGRVDEKRVDELILRRDNRPVTIKE